MSRKNKFITLPALLVASIIGSMSIASSASADSSEIYAQLQGPTILKASQVEGEPAFSCTKKTTYTYPYPVNKEQVNTYHCENAHLKYIPVSEDGVTPKRAQVAGWLENKMSITNENHFNYSAACSMAYWYNGQRIIKFDMPDNPITCNTIGAIGWHDASYNFVTPVTQEVLVEAAKNKQSEVTLATWGFSWDIPQWEGGSQRIIIMLDVNSTYLYGLDGNLDKPLFNPEIAAQLAEGKDPFSPEPTPTPGPDEEQGGGDSGNKGDGDDEGDKGNENDKGDGDKPTEGSGSPDSDSNNQGSSQNNSQDQNNTNGSTNSENQSTPKAPDTGENTANQNTNNAFASLSLILLSSAFVGFTLYQFRRH